MASATPDLQLPFQPVPNYTARWTTCPRLLPDSGTVAGVEPATVKSQVQRPNHYSTQSTVTTHNNWISRVFARYVSCLPATCLTGVAIVVSSSTGKSVLVGVMFLWPKHETLKLYAEAIC